jgi:hypothetical protein
LSLRDWLIDTVTVEVAPPRYTKFILLVPAALYGGWMFATTGSWLTAIQWYFWAYLIAWAFAKVAELIGQGVVRAILWMWPPFSFQQDTPKI